MAKDPVRWLLVDDEQKERRLTDRKLRVRIKDHDYSGHELVRGVDEPESALRPLHTLPLYAGVLGVPPEEAEFTAHARKVRGFAFHLAAFLGVMALTGPQFWFAFWGIGLFAHFSNVARSLEWLRGTGRPLAAILGFGAQGATLPAPTEPRESEAPGVEASDPLERSVRAEWSTVQGKVDGAVAAELAEAWVGVERSLERRRGLLAILEGESEEALQADLARLEADAAGADPVTREALDASGRAVQSRLEALKAAKTAELRLRARIEAMLHQLKAVGLSLAAKSEESTDLEAQVVALRDEARAAAEMEEALAEARSADKKPRPQRA